jgi:hypothetical protein
MVTEAQLKDVKRRFALRLLELERVSGVGIEKDESGRFVLAIHLNDSSPKGLDLPAELKDVPIKYHRQDGGFRKQTGTGRE